MPTVLVVTVSGDIHAHAVRAAVRDGARVDVHVVECDRISGRPTVSWSPWPQRSVVLTDEGAPLSLSDVDVIWWRRVNATQEVCERVPDQHERNLIDNDCRGAFSGMLAASFRGRWVSSPTATTRASDKLYQLTVASAAGFRVPETLVTQSRAEVFDFAERVGRIIVKPVVGAAGPLMFTQFGETLADVAEESFATAPAMYQEYVPGTRHIRLNSFGGDVYAAAIDTDDLDWRPDLRVPMSRWEVPETLRRTVARTLAALDLRMGVIDLKLTPEGEAVWLEVNPQGQFLFLEPLTGEPLTRHFARFLETTALEAAGARA